MSLTDFQDATLVLIGHGSTKNDHSADAVIQQARLLQARNLFADVKAAFWKQEPKLVDVASALNSARAFFVPMFVSEGYFSEGAIPRAIGFADSRVQNRVQAVVKAAWFYCKPIGTHDRMTPVLLSKARQSVSQFPFPRAPKESDITLFIAGHGTPQDEASRKSVERQAELIRDMNIYAAVHAVFLEEEPRIASAYDLAQTKNIVIVPFFIGDGMHVQEDIPILLGEPERIVKKRLAEGTATWRNPTERKGKLVWYTDSVGSDPGLIDIILDRVREAQR